MINRRDFLKTACASTAALAMDPVSVFAAGANTRKKSKGASDKVNVAFVGIGHRGEEDAIAAYETGMCNVLALCDVNIGAPYTQKVLGMFPEAKRYQDFRKMFDEMSDKLDAVFVATPDFSHFPIAMRALREGLHIYCEKPMGATFYECQLLMEEAAKHPDLITQLGNQGHSGRNYFQFKAWTEAGIVKNVTKIDLHMNYERRWHKFDVNIKKFPAAEPIPSTMDWDLWQMHTMYHDYSLKLDEGNWRCWYGLGMGALGDWGPHMLDTIHEFLDLGLPTEVGMVKAEGHNDYFYPMSSTIRFKFPRRGNKPACTLTWYDGIGNWPELPEGFVNENAAAGDIPLVNGQQMKNMKLNPGRILYSDDLIFQGRSHAATLKIIPKSLHEEMDRKGLLPHEPEDYHYNHYMNFFNAILGKETVHSPFSIAAPLCQVLNLGVIAQRLNTTFHFDRNTKEIYDNPFANSLLYGNPPRKGWENYFKI